MVRRNKHKSNYQIILVLIIVIAFLLLVSAFPQAPAGQQALQLSVEKKSDPQVIVGAPYYNSPTTGQWAGKAYVYSATGRLLWSKEGENLLAPNNFTADLFGKAVSSVPDIDGDGRDDFVIGAPEDPIPPASGNVYVYSSLGTLLWNRSGELDAFPGGERFGFAVSGIPDVNGDGRGDVVVGAPEFWGAGGPSSGKVYVFSGINGSPIWTAEGSNDTHRFGWSVGGVTDLDGDGRGDVIIGEPQYHPPSGGYGENGKVTVLSGSNGTVVWTDEGEDSDQLGYSVSGVTDVDGDGYGDVVAGAPETNDFPPALGYVRVYSGFSGSVLWNASSESGITAWPLFGWSVSGVPDMDSDGRGDVVVGAPAWSSLGTFFQPGKIYTFSGSSGSSLWNMTGENTFDNFGFAVSGIRDLNSDGKGDLVVGAIQYDGGASNTGKAYVYSGTGEELWTKEGEEQNNLFGWAVGGSKL